MNIYDLRQPIGQQLALFEHGDTERHDLTSHDLASIVGPTAWGSPYIQSGGISYEYYEPAIWKVMSLADAAINGERGIRPTFSVKEARDAWDSYIVDAAGTLYVRDFSRIFSATIVVEGEVWLHRNAGKYTILPPPFKVLTNERGYPAQYVYRNPVCVYCPKGARPEPGIDYEDGEVEHVMIRWLPQQLRGASAPRQLALILRDRRDYIQALIKKAKQEARMSVVLKRGHGIPGVGMDTNAEVEQKQAFNFMKDGLFQLGPADELSTISGGQSSTSPEEVDRIVMNTFAQRFGLSRPSVTGDYSDTSYSSQRAAAINDQIAWRRYQDVLHRYIKELYLEWPERIIYDQYFTGWHIPSMPNIDPQKTAYTDATLFRIHVKSPQTIQQEYGLDPETEAANFEEYQRRFPNGLPTGLAEGGTAGDTTSGASIELERESDAHAVHMAHVRDTIASGGTV